ncbi:MAG TPA: helix-turn-helix domain-containing protein [Gemmatimonadaceae bacterium]|nr:helix-turn-helix domain-containing protein [Gemmatimonadaceae bacterium]
MVYRTTKRGEAVRAATQARILGAAGKLFARKGYEATTMQEIVSEADTSIGNAYFYFRNKETLLRALVEDTSSVIFDAAERRAQHVKNGPERVGAIIAINTTTFLTVRRDMLQILTADSRRGVIHAIGDIAVQRWVPVLSAAFPERAEEELPLIAAAIWGANRSIVERMGSGTIDVPTRDAVTFMVRWTLGALGVRRDRIERIVASAWRLATRHARDEGGESW